MFSRIDRRTKDLNWFFCKQNCHERMMCVGRGGVWGDVWGGRGRGKRLKKESEEGKQNAQHYYQLRGGLKRNWY